MIPAHCQSHCLALKEYARDFLDGIAKDGALPPAAGKLPNVMTTAETLAAFREARILGNSFKEEEAVRFILRQQDLDGGWTDPNEDNPWDVSSTAWAIHALRNISYPIDPRVVDRGIDWLEAAILADGGLPTNKHGDISNSYASSYALRAVGTSRITFSKRVLEFLAQIQNGDGGWGLWPSDPSEPTLTAYVLHGLLDSNMPESAPLSRRGLDYLRDVRDELGRWGSWLESGPSVEGTAFCMYIFRRHRLVVGEQDAVALEYLRGKIAAPGGLDIEGVSQIWMASSLILLSAAFLKQLDEAN